jgi:hypothetical protein
MGQTSFMSEPEPRSGQRENERDRRRRQSEHFFARESDGSVRLRIRFDGDEASLMEEAAGSTPLLAWIHKTLGEAARREVEETHRALQQIEPPPDAD